MGDMGLLGGGFPSQMWVQVIWVCWAVGVGDISLLVGGFSSATVGDMGLFNGGFFLLERDNSKKREGEDQRQNTETERKLGTKLSFGD